MKIYLYLFLSAFLIISCNSNDGEEVSSGFNLSGLKASCVTERDSFRPIQGCTLEFSETDDINNMFDDICDAEGGVTYSCLPCGKEVLCSKPLDVLISGYDRFGNFKSNIPTDFDPFCMRVLDLDVSAEELFADKCEAMGYIATLVGCSFDYYLCSEKI